MVVTNFKLPLVGKKVEMHEEQTKQKEEESKMQV